MTKLLKEAMAVLKDLPEDLQDTAARAIIDYASTLDCAFLSLSETTDRLRHFGI